MNVCDMEDRSLLVYQAEPTNHCNATCTYCPQPTHARPRGFMSAETFKHVLRVMQNKIVTLHHFGEPLLHKQLEALVELAVADGVHVALSTNGKGLTQRRLDSLISAGLGTVHLHVDPFGVRLRSFVFPEGFDATEHRLLVAGDAPKKELQSFAGYLDVNNGTRGLSRCSFLKDGWRVVLWNGDVALCCNDVEGDGSISCASCDGYVFKSPLDWGEYDGQEPGADAAARRRLPVLR